MDEGEDDALARWRVRWGRIGVGVYPKAPQWWEMPVPISRTNS
jgi:hypothetical protein